MKIYVGALSPDGLVRVTPLKNFVDSLLPEGLVTMTHMKIYVGTPSPDELVSDSTRNGCSVTRWVGESDSTKEFC